MRAFFLLILLSNAFSFETLEKSKIKPLKYYLNGSFDTTQLQQYFNTRQWFHNHEVVFNRFINPKKAIEETGNFNSFIKDELLSVRALPNFALHSIGGGMDFRYFCDYFEKESYKHPKLSAFALTYLTNWGNEALEVSGSNRITPPSDTISDLLFFDLIGKSLMLNDDIYNFFKNYVTTYFNFISLNASQKKIESAGLYYLAESKQSKSKYKVFSLIGMKQVVGLTIKSRLSDYRVGFSANYEDPLDFKGGKFGIMFQKEARGYSDILITINDLENYKFKAYFTPPGFSPEGLTMMLGYMTDHSIALGLRLERSFSLTI